MPPLHQLPRVASTTAYHRRASRTPYARYTCTRTVDISIKTFLLYWRSVGDLLSINKTGSGSTSLQNYGRRGMTRALTGSSLPLFWTGSPVGGAVARSLCFPRNAHLRCLMVIVTRLAPHRAPALPPHCALPPAPPLPGTHARSASTYQPQLQQPAPHGQLHLPAHWHALPFTTCSMPDPTHPQYSAVLAHMPAPTTPSSRG